ncbi:MAG: hypothetical protein R3F48_02020 [Candidatus Zixiibacteriota bacterium]
MMRKRCVILGILLFCILVCLPTDSVATEYFSADLTECLNTITAHIYNDRFDKAEHIIDSLYASRCCRPFDFLAYSILYQSVMMANESDSLEAEFFASLDSVQVYAEGMLAEGRDSVLAYYLLGHQFAFRSLYAGRAGHTWSAIKKGLKARNAYSKGFELDSTFFDIALGLGSYRYWKSVKTNAVNWTPLFKNEKGNGIELLRRAADSSEISRDAAQTSLIWVYINEKRYTEAIRLADEMRRRYPHGLTFLWALGEAYYQLGDCDQALLIYTNIYARLQNNPGNYYNIIEAAWYQAKCYRRHYKDDESRREEACELYEAILTLPIPEETAKRQKDKLKDIKKACQ